MEGGSLTSISRNRVVQAEETLVISGGSLAIRGNSYSGGKPGVLTAPRVSIEGGVVSLTAEGTNSASIRGAEIIISGGAVSATGTGTNAAIGCWDATYPTGTIVITGGNIKAQGGPTSVSAIGGVSHTGTEIYPTNGTVRVYETEVEADWIRESSSVLIDELEYFLAAHQGSSAYTLYLPAGMHVIEGASDHYTVYTNPESSIMGTIPLSIVDGTNGKVLTNARLTLRNSTGSIIYQGIAPGHLYLPEGTYQAVISCSGYHTRQREIIIIQGENDKVLIPLNGSNTLGAHIVVTQMTLEDMKVAGIDPDAVGNQHLFLFEVTLEFVARNPVEFSYIGTAEGGPGIPPAPSSYRGAEG